MEKSLTPKQQRFVEEYLLDLNATQAAIRAGYSKKTARNIASENMAKPDIQQAITTATRERSEATRIDAAWVLRRLTDEATADLAELYDKDGGLKPVKDWPLVWRQGLVQGVDVDETFEAGARLAKVTRVRLSDRIRRLELIGKHVDIQAFAERKEITGPGGGPIQFEASIMQAARSILYLLRKGEELAGPSGLQQENPPMKTIASSPEPRGGDTEGDKGVPQ